ncbi:MAG TPA: hypothetical protein PKD24_15025 [Pyrinomonadaceae bacterium]|nr:hypothetical protein [Pyrinomonadaceae bacterium]HMP66774.1 hypothetical protein [Pyrinomonadaceae bacterium]
MTNIITTSGFQYDSAGNQTTGFAEDGTPLLFEYDAANRIYAVKRASDNSTVQAFHYGSTNARLMALDYASNQWTIYASTGGTTLAEYTEFTEHTPTWTKTYTYLGSSQLATVTPNGSGGEYVEFNHPDRLGTRLVTNSGAGAFYAWGGSAPVVEYTEPTASWTLRPHYIFWLFHSNGAIL